MKPRAFLSWWLSALVWGLWAVPLPGQELGQEGYADSNGVKIHYVTLGEGPLVVMLHGFPDYWYTWRDQMPVLAKHYQKADGQPPCRFAGELKLSKEGRRRIA